MIREFILNLLFPPRCVWCGKIIDSGDECAECRNHLPHRSGSVKTTAYYSAAAAPLMYRDRVRDSILRFKFRKKRTYAGVYARYLSDTIKRELDGRFDVISFVPVSDKRKRERGFDQSELLCEETAKLLGMECVRTLRKTRNTNRQSRLQNEAERHANILGAYEAVGDVEGRRILLIDDIMTTGATMKECARTLRLAGAEDVVAACLADAGKKNRKNKKIAMKERPV